MSDSRSSTLISRRALLRTGGALAGGALIAPALPRWIAPLDAWTLWQAAADAAAKRRAEMAAVPIQQTKLADRLTMLSGPGGNVVVLDGPDGKVVVDCFVQPAWDKLKQALDGLGSAPIKAVIDTHWHFDHADNNANLRKLGAAVIAHENTRKRLTETHSVLGMTFPPSPPEALPTDTFKDTHTLQANGEQIALGHIPPAHTDTDIYIRFTKANVLHLGDLYFNGMYPFFDATTGGNITGMIAAADRALKLADGSTTIVPGHGPLGDMAKLKAFRDMMATARDRVAKLKSAGRSLDETIAEAPTKDLDPTWGKGFLQPRDFVTLIYTTL